MIALVKGLILLVEIGASYEVLATLPDICRDAGGTWVRDRPTFYQSASCYGLSFDHRPK